MVNIKKTVPGPACLDVEKEKKNGTYNCGNVLALMREDFYNKCYICEWKEPISINIEHFEPHMGDKEKKFDWKNLYFSCGHCNNIKGDQYNTNRENRILDCTNPAPEHDVEKLLTLRMDYIGTNRNYQKKVVISFECDDDECDDEIVRNTAKLLDEVYNGTTLMKEMEAENMKKMIVEKLYEFQQVILLYKNCDDNDHEKKACRKRIEELMAPTEAFSAFKRSLWENLF